MAKKSKAFYITRSIVRGTVKTVMLLAAYLTINLAAYNIWTALLFVGVVLGGFAIYDFKAKPVPVVIKK
jgi:hypothetical protein